MYLLFTEGYLSSHASLAIRQELCSEAIRLALLEDFKPPTWLAGSYLWTAVLADLHRRCGNEARAARYRDAAIELAPTAALRELLKRRLSAKPG